MEAKDTSTSLETPRQHQFTFNLILTYYSIMSEHTFRMRGHDVFAAVGDPTRRAMLDLLRKGELAAGEIGRPFRISRPAISQHLSVLKRSGLVTARRAGREQIYSLRPEPLRAIQEWVDHYRQFWPQKLDALGDFLRKSKP